MPKEQGVTYNFDAVNSLGAKPKLAYWMAKSTWKQNVLFVFSLLLLITPIAAFLYASIMNIVLMQQICFVLSLFGIVQFLIIQDFFETINFISHAESCRQRQVIGCQKIQSLNETIASNSETLRQKRTETTQIMEQNEILQIEVDSLKLIVNDHSAKDTQSARIVNELSDAINKVIKGLPSKDNNLNEIKTTLKDLTKTLQTHGDKIIINGQHYAALKGLLLKISDTPHNFSRYSELSEKTIKRLERKNLYLADIMHKIQHATIKAQVEHKPGIAISPEFQRSNIILDIHHLSTQSIEALKTHPESQSDNQERLSLAQASVNTNNPIMRQASMFEAIGEYVGLSPTKGSGKA